MNSEEIFELIRQKKSEFDRFGASRIGLFGSQIRGEASAESDIDFIVEFVTGQKNHDNYINLCLFLEDLFNKKIDLLTLESLSPHLKDRILGEAQYEIIHWLSSSHT